mmetsp:Transcript_4795/g.9508  ORF Transcript_4795/g.9508 Transcript_4795/m.9508 type:complete len:274 (-) Transcript_4795:450-1271(-)
MRLSNMWKMSEDGWWIVATTVRPAAARLLSVWTTLKAVNVSRPEVGSSRNRMEGSVMSSIAIAVLFLSPPEIPPRSPGFPMTVSAHRCRCRILMTFSTRDIFSSIDMAVGRRSLADMKMTSRTVIVANTTSSWKTKTEIFLITSDPTLAPFTRIYPDKLPPAASPATALRRVVLPAPEAPMMAVNLPAANTPSMPCRIVFFVEGLRSQHGPPPGSMTSMRSLWNVTSYLFVWVLASFLVSSRSSSPMSYSGYSGIPSADACRVWLGGVFACPM